MDLAILRERDQVPNPGTCPVMMSDRQFCGRKLWSHNFASESGLCIMHSPQPEKDSDEFNQELLRVLDGTSSGSRGEIVDCTRFVFPKDTSLKNVEVKSPAVFAGAEFLGFVDFTTARFHHSVSFSAATFHGIVRFAWTDFLSTTKFAHCTFVKDAFFRMSTFHDKSDFLACEFMEAAIFRGVRFRRDSSFAAVAFRGYLDFLDAEFAPEPRENIVDEEVANSNVADNGAEVIADFSYVHFGDPSAAALSSLNKAAAQPLRICLKGCNIEGAELDDVNWYRRSGRLVLQDEVFLREKAGNAWSPKDYELIAIAYRQLISTFETVRNYELAEQCMVGVMEMRLLDKSRPLLSKAFVLGYKWISVYGTSYWQALAVLALVIGVVFPAAFSARISGLFISQSAIRLHVPDPVNALHSRIAAGLIHSLEVASFQRATIYTTGGAGGHLLEIVESIVVAVIISLLLLAVRRQFRH